MYMLYIHIYIYTYIHTYIHIYIYTYNTYVYTYAGFCLNYLVRLGQIRLFGSIATGTPMFDLF